MGAELIGDSSARADAELLALVIEALLNAGLKQFQISVGQVEYFKGICDDAGLDEDTELVLREYISNKNLFGAESLLMEKCISERHRNVLLRITEMFGGIDFLAEAKALAGNKRSEQAIHRLEEVFEVLKLYGLENYVSFDLGMLSKYQYYTGIIFKAYTYGVGDAIVKGGRYDNLLSRFGKNAPAIGFVAVIDDLLEALNRQQIPVPVKKPPRQLFYTEDTFEETLTEAARLRNEGICVEMIEKSRERALCTGSEE